MSKIDSDPSSVGEGIELGTLIHFRDAARRREPEQLVSSDRFAEYRLKVAEIQASQSIIDRNVRIIESILHSTKDQEFRTRLLDHLKEIQDRLFAASLNLRNAEQDLLRVSTRAL